MESTDLSPWFVTGLIEGEGCFSVSFSLRKRLKLGIETRPSFSISLNKRDLELIKTIKEFFGCGAVRYSKNDRTYKFEVRSVSDLVGHVIPHFQQYQLIGSKLNDFRLFVKICKEVHGNMHRNEGHLRQIIEQAYKMNPSGKRKHEMSKLLRILDELKV